MTLVQGLPRVETGLFPGTSVLYSSRTAGQLLLSEHPWKKLTETSGQLLRRLRCLFWQAERRTGLPELQGPEEGGCLGRGDHTLGVGCFTSCLTDT